jgi:ribosome-associated heat shock protein Hsp15
MRIDKFLWAVRMFKTRTLASEECKKGKVQINNMNVKPSREIKAGEIVQVKKNPVVFSLKVIEPIERRVSAKLVSQYVENITSPEELAKLDRKSQAGTIIRDPHTGRPTKRDRRELDDILDTPWDWDDETDEPENENYKVI